MAGGGLGLFPIDSESAYMFNLIPKEVRFYDYFEQQSEHMIKGAGLLYELVHNFQDARAKAHAIKEVEHQGDQVTHEIVKKLNTTFITPIDREDIHALATRLDDVLDSSAVTQSSPYSENGTPPPLTNASDTFGAIASSAVAIRNRPPM